MNTTHKGSCHCGAVRFEADVEATKGSRCNCSICTKVNMTGAILKPAAFRLVAGEQALSTYEWGHHISKRFFCAKCGVYCFAKGHLVELGGDYVSINLQALDDIDPGLLEIGHWDGRHDNWQGGMRGTPWPIGEANSA
jgi:hypothetical protein